MSLADEENEAYLRVHSAISEYGEACARGDDQKANAARTKLLVSIERFALICEEQAVARGRNPLTTRPLMRSMLLAGQVRVNFMAALAKPPAGGVFADVSEAGVTGFAIPSGCAVRMTDDGFEVLGCFVPWSAVCALVLEGKLSVLWVEPLRDKSAELAERIAKDNGAKPTLALVPPDRG